MMLIFELSTNPDPSFVPSMGRSISTRQILAARPSISRESNTSIREHVLVVEFERTWFHLAEIDLLAEQIAMLLNFSWTAPYCI